MSASQIIRFVLEALVFAAWALMVYRMVSVVRARDAEQNTGFVAQFKAWLKSDEDKQERKTLFFLTFVLAAMIAMNVMSSQ